MIRPLRRRHLWLVGALAVVVAPLFVAALAVRPAPAIQPALPAGMAPAAAIGDDHPGSSALPAAAAPSAVRAELPTTPPIRLRPMAGGAIEASGDGSVEGADLLLYWAPADGGRSLADAHLLGALRGGERQLLRLPAAAAGADGVLILYSLGHGDELARAPWPTIPEPGP